MLAVLGRSARRRAADQLAGAALAELGWSGGAARQAVRAWQLQPSRFVVAGAPGDDLAGVLAKARRLAGPVGVLAGEQRVTVAAVQPSRHAWLVWRTAHLSCCCRLPSWACCLPARCTAPYFKVCWPSCRRVWIDMRGGGRRDHRAPHCVRLQDHPAAVGPCCFQHACRLSHAAL